MSLTEIPGGPPPPIKDPSIGREAPGTTRTTSNRTITHRETQPPEVVSPRTHRPGTIDDRGTRATSTPSVEPEPDGELGVTRRAMWRELAKRWLPPTAGVAAGVAVIAGEASMPEQQPRNPNMQFLTADHYEGDANNEAQNDLEAGNLSRNAWEQDGSILGYLRHFQPSALYVDRSSIHGIKLDYYYAVPSLREWRPQATYNGQQGAFVIAGDTPYSALLEEASIGGLGTKLDAIEAQERNKRDISATDLIDAVTGTLLTAAATSGAIMSRRKFLAITAGFSALAVLTGNKSLDLFSRIPQSTWLEGRDALAVAKTEEGVALLQQNGLMKSNEASAIIMGSAHGQKAKSFMSQGGTAERNKSIYNFAKYTVDTMLRVMREHYQRDLSQQEIDFTTERILNNFASMQIAHVSTPETADRIRKKELDAYVENHVQYVYDEPLVSQQVITAVRPLFPSGRNPRTSVPQAVGRP